jgi:uncharacterized protein YdeI (YjbR/CyaY-like superfamily)
MHETPIIPFANAQEWEEWLGQNQTQFEGLWLKIAKKDSGIPTVSYLEALEVALCYGWIDGQKKSFDEKYFLQKFTPRRKNSVWSKTNRERVGRLTIEGKMQAAGTREVELAKADGRWDAAYDSQSNATVPEDFQSELDKNPAAKEFFDTLNSTNRYSILYRIQSAKKPETRRARIEKFIAMLLDKKKL